MYIKPDVKAKLRHNLHPFIYRINLEKILNIRQKFDYLNNSFVISLIIRANGLLLDMKLQIVFTSVCTAGSRTYATVHTRIFRTPCNKELA